LTRRYLLVMDRLDARYTRYTARAVNSGQVTDALTPYPSTCGT